MRKNLYGKVVMLGEKFRWLRGKVEEKSLNSLGEKLKGNVELLGRKVERKC